MLQETEQDSNPVFALKVLKSTVGDEVRQHFSNLYFKEESCKYYKGMRAILHILRMFYVSSTYAQVWERLFPDSTVVKDTKRK